MAIRDFLPSAGGFFFLGLIFLLGTGCTVGDPDANDTNDNQQTGDDAGFSDTDDTGGQDTCTELSQADINGGVTLDDECYVVHGTPTVSDGQLVIAAGTTVYFGDEAGIEIQSDGSLTAEGTSDDPVYLLGLEEEPGYWMGLRFRSNSADNRLEHVELEHAGHSRWHSTSQVTRGGVVFQGSARLAISDSIFRHNQFAGVSAEVTGRSFSVESTNFESNETPLVISAGNMEGLAPDLTFSDNENEVVRVVRGDIVDDTTWPALEVPFQVRSTITVEDDAALTIDAGASFIFDLHEGLAIEDNATIAIEGTDQEPVHMAGTESTPGHWLGIALRNTVSTDNRIENLVLEHAGSERWHSTSELAEGGLVVRDSDVRLEVVDSEFRNNRFAGISLRGSGANVFVSGSTFENNDYPIQARINHVADIDADNEFLGDNSVLVVGSSDMTRDGTWDALATSIEFTSDPTVTADLTISPGTQLTFRNHAGIEIDGGTISAVGEDTDPIIFSGVESLQGFWKGLRLRNSMTTDNEIGHVEIQHAGSERWHSTTTGADAGIVVQHSSRLELNDTHISDSGGYAIGVPDGDSEITGCSNVTYDNIAESSPVFGADQTCL